MNYKRLEAIRRAFVRIARDNRDNGVPVNTKYNRNDIRRFLTVGQKKILSTQVNRANGYRMIKFKAYKNECARMGRQFLDSVPS